MKFKPVTLKEIESVWGNSSFGLLNDSKMDVVKAGLLKWASGYRTGYTLKKILQDLGLIGIHGDLTVRGKRQLWEFFSFGISL